MPGFNVDNSAARSNNVGDVIGAAIQDFAAMLRDALSQPGPWIAVAAVIVVVFVAAALRSKLSSSWIWIPVLAGAMYFVVYRWLRLR